MLIDGNFLRQKYLWGMNLTSEEGEPLPNEMLEQHIEAAQDRIQRALDLQLEPTTFVDEIDYYVSDYQNWSFLNLYHRPVLEIKKLDMIFAGGSLVTFPKEWIKITEDKGTIQLFPTTGTLGSMIITGAGNWLPIVLRRWKYAPQLWRVEYIAGFESGQCPASIIDIIAKEAIIGVSSSFIDVVVGFGVGSQNISVDGISQGTTMLAEHPRVRQYRKDVEEFWTKLSHHFRGIDFAIL